MESSFAADLSFALALEATDSDFLFDTSSMGLSAFGLALLQSRVPFFFSSTFGLSEIFASLNLSTTAGFSSDTLTEGALDEEATAGAFVPLRGAG